MFNITEIYKDESPNIILLITKYIKSVMDNELYTYYVRSDFNLLCDKKGE